VAGLPSKEGGFGRTGRAPRCSGMRRQRRILGGVSRSALPPHRFCGRPSTVAAQEGDPHSTLNTVRALIALRQAHPALQASGAFAAVVARTGEVPFVYERSSGRERILVAVNRRPPCEVRLPATVKFSEVRKLAAKPKHFKTTPEVDREVARSQLRGGRID